MNGCLFKEDIQTAYWPISLVIRKMQIKTTMSYHFTHTRIARVKKSDITSVSEDVEKLELCTLLVGMQNATVEKQFGSSSLS